MTKRKSFSSEFKREAVRLLETSQKPAADLARELGVRRNQLYKWKEQLGLSRFTWIRTCIMARRPRLFAAGVLYHVIVRGNQRQKKAILCQKDQYLLQLIRYIHLNPVRAGMVRSPERYRYSGDHVYLQGKATETIDPATVLSMLGGKQAYRRFVQDGLSEGHKEEYYAVEDQRFLGAEGFGARLRKKETGLSGKRLTRRSIETAARELVKLLKIDVQALRSPDRGWAISKARTIAAYVLVRRLGYRLSDVAAYFGRDMATLATLLARLSDRVQANDPARREIERLNEIVES